MTAERIGAADGRHATGRPGRSPTRLLEDLEAGRIRAAEPDPAVPGGWRVRSDVKAAILDRFRDRTAATWAAGPLTFRDRATVPPRDVRDGPWRVVPGGTAVRRGAHLGSDVVVMPPSYVNVGAWIGDGTMVDSHVLVGSCAQIGASVHLAAGVTIGGVLEPPGARPVIVEDGAFVGAGSALLDGVLVGREAVIGAGVTLTGTSRLYDLVRERVIDRHRRRAAGRAARRGRDPGRPRGRRRVRPDARPVGRGGAARQGPRCRHERPRRAGGGPPMSASLDPPGRPRRGRPPARNEILQAGRLAGLDPRDLAERFGTPLYVYDLDVIDRQVAALRAVLPERVDLAYAVKANPALAIVAHLGSLGLGADVASEGELATAIRAGIRPDRIVMTGPGKRDDGARGGGRRRDPRGDRRIARRARTARAASRARPAGASRCCSARRCRRSPGSNGSASSATTGPASSGWMRAT